MFFSFKKLSHEIVLRKLTGLFLFLIPWQTIWIVHEQYVGDSKWELGTYGFYATEILLWIIILLFFAWYWKKQRHDIAQKRFHFSWTADRLFALSCLLFLVYVLATTFFAHEPMLAAQHASRLTAIVCLFFVLFIGPLRAKEAVMWFVSGAVIQSVLALWQFLSQSTFESTLLGMSAHPAWQAGTSVVSSGEIGRWLRAYGAFAHPNILGAYLVVSLFCTGWLSNQVHISHSKNAFSMVCKYALFAFIMTIQVIALFVTFSRAAWIAFSLYVIGILFGGIYKKYRYLARLGMYLIFIVGLFAVIFYPLIHTRLVPTSVNERASIEERYSGIAAADKMAQEHWLFGVGAGNYTAVLHDEYPSLSGWQLQPVHNAPLLFFVEFGIVGFVFFLGILFLFARYINQSSKRLSRTLLQPSYVGSYILFVASFFALIFFDHYLYSFYVGLVIGVVFWGIMLRALAEENEFFLLS